MTGNFEAADLWKFQTSEDSMGYFCCIFGEKSSFQNADLHKGVQMGAS